MATTNCPSTNTTASFAAQVSWGFTPSAPSISLTGTSGDNSISASASASSSTGTFSVSSVYGSRTGTNTYSASHTMTVSFSVSNISWSRTGCDVYFNTSSGTSWSNMSWSGTAATTSSTTLQLTTSNTTVSSMNNRVFRGTVNLGYSTSIEYSLDNSTWQSNGNFTGLTPNTTYTVYARARSTSASGSTSGYGYASRSVTLGSKPENLTITCVGKTINSLTISVSADNMGASGSYYELYWAPDGTTNWTKISLGTSTTTTITDLLPETKYKFFLKAVNAVGESFTINVPNGYTPKEYLQSSGTQYIDTGYKPKYNARLDYKYQYDATSPQQQIIFGFYGNLVGAWYINSSNAIAYSWNNSSGSWTSTGVAVNTNVHTAMVDGANGKVQMDSSTWNMAGTHTNNASQNIFLYHMNDNGSPASTSAYAKAKIFYFTAIENDKYVHFYIPCLNSNNVAGMYDVMTDTFYQNNGSGTFAVGNNITNDQTIFETDPELPTGIYHKESNVWEIGQPYYKINGVWVRAGGIFYNEDGTWQQVKL